MKNRILDMFSSPPATAEDRQRLEQMFDRQRWQASAEQWIAEHPGLALGAALTVGVLVGWLIKRK